MRGESGQRMRAKSEQSVIGESGQRVRGKRRKWPECERREERVES